MYKIINKINHQIKNGLRVGEVFAKDKEQLQKLRNYLKQQGYTEAKLLYRKGKYVVVIIFEKVDKLGLAQAGFIKVKRVKKRR